MTPEIASHTHILDSQAPMPRHLMHRSAWKVHSANFGGVEKGHEL
jgi:hypothetical protein